MSGNLSFKELNTTGFLDLSPELLKLFKGSLLELFIPPLIKAQSSTPTIFSISQLYQDLPVVDQSTKRLRMMPYLELRPMNRHGVPKCKASLKKLRQL